MWNLPYGSRFGFRTSYANVVNFGSLMLEFVTRSIVAGSIYCCRRSSPFAAVQWALYWISIRARLSHDSSFRILKDDSTKVIRLWRGILKDDSTTVVFWKTIRLWRDILKVDSSDICRVSKTLLSLLNVVKTFSKIHLKVDFFNLGLIRKVQSFTMVSFDWFLYLAILVPWNRFWRKSFNFAAFRQFKHAQTL